MSDQSNGSKRFVVAAMILAAIFSAIPVIVGTLMAPAGTFFIGYPYATDDHMVYAAWMRQAQEGRFLFENRFAYEAQPGLTIHFLFLVLGWISKLVGIVGATTIAKAALSSLFVWQIYRLVGSMGTSVFARNWATIGACLGSGLGFVLWHQFGEANVSEKAPLISSFLGGRLPIDVWQPEAFVASSMLTNALFMAALCLIVGVFQSLIDCRDEKRAVLWGAAQMFLLANIHTYDVVLLALVGGAFALSMAVRGELSKSWFLRCVAVFAGGIPTALWSVYVLRVDPVFQARAATLTYSASFRQVIVGLGLLFLGGLVFFAKLTDGKRKPIAWFGLAGAVALLASFSPATEGYPVPKWAFGLSLVLILISSTFFSVRRPAEALVASWALIGLVAPYVPLLFQRKLAMGLSVPWAILAAVALAKVVEDLATDRRRMVMLGSVAVASVCSVLWLTRELAFIKADVSRTTVQPIFLTSEVADILDTLRQRSSERPVVLAIPGVPSFAEDTEGLTAIDKFQHPLIPDLNPVVTGFAGSISVAGHWSETPDYVERRKMAQVFFSRRTSNATRRQIVEQTGAKYALGPSIGSFGGPSGSAFLDLSSIGRVLVQGEEFTLVEIDLGKL